MINCKDCKYWRLREEPIKWNFPQLPGECERMENTYEHDDEGVYKSDSMAAAMDASGWHAGVYTKPDFGCVMGEKK